MDLAFYFNRIIAPYVRARIANDRGASLVEYALLVALIAIVCIAAVRTLGGNINSRFEQVGNGVGTATP